MKKLKKTCLEGLPQKVNKIFNLLYTTTLFFHQLIFGQLFNSTLHLQPRILDFALSLFHFASSALRISAIKRASNNRTGRSHSHDGPRVFWVSGLPSNVEIWIQSSKLQFKTPHPGVWINDWGGKKTQQKASLVVLAKIPEKKCHIKNLLGCSKTITAQLRNQVLKSSHPWVGQRLCASVCRAYV